MFCPRCGAEMKPEQRYCMKCGALNYEHPDNQKMKTYITPEEFDQANKDYNDASKHEVETVEFAGRTYETKTKKKKGYIDARSAVLLLLIITILLGLLAYFWLNYSITFILAICVIYFIISFFVIVSALIYMKGGYSGFTPIIPFYSQYAYYDIAVGNGWKFLFLLIPVFGLFYGMYVNYRLGKVFNKNGWLTLFFPIIMLPVIALSDKAIYQGKGKQYEKFIASGKRRNVQIPSFVYSIIFFLIFVGLSYTPLASSGKQYFYIFDVKLLVNQVNQNIIDGFYLCEDPSADKNGCYVKFSNASDLTDYPFIPIRSSLNGKKLQGYIKAVRKKEDYTYYVSITDGENGFQNKNVNNLTIQSLDKVNKIKLSKDAPLYKKS